MSVTHRVPTMTRDQFFDWAEAEGGRYEFDGFQPVAMTERNLNHNQIAFNVLVALRGRLGGTGCRPHGMDAGVATVGDTVRYPDGVGQRWTVTSVMAGDLLSLPEIGIEIPAAELYEGIEFPTSDIAAMSAE